MMKTLVQRSFPNSMIRAAEGDESGNIIEGYAVVWDTLYEIGSYRETVKKGAFTKTLSEQPDIRLTINHDANLIVARTSNESLEVWEDDTGLGFRANLGKNAGGETSYVSDLKKNLVSGLLKQCSFMFDVIRSRNVSDDSGTLTELLECSLAEGDVSIVTYPAYLETTVQLRKLQRSGIDLQSLVDYCKSAEGKKRIEELLKEEPSEETETEETKPEETEPEISDDDLRLMGEFASVV